MTEKVVTEESVSCEGSDPQASENGYVKMASQWSRKLEEAKELNQQLRLFNLELERKITDLQRQIEGTEQRIKALKAERELAVRLQANREKQMKTVAMEHSMEVQELQERISFLERRLESMESGKELRERISYLEQQLVARESEVRLLMQQSEGQLASLGKSQSTLERKEQETEMQRLLMEKIELERHLNDCRSDGIRKDREISRMSRSMEEMDRELDLMKSLLQPTHTPVSPPRSRRSTLNKRLSKRLSWFSERMGGAKLGSFSESVEVQPLTEASSSSHVQKAKMRHARSLDTLDLPPPTRKSLKVNWSKKAAAKAPTNRMVRGAAVVHKGIVYFSSYLTPSIWGYKSAQGQWFQLADCPNVFFALAIINGCLTAIGGQRSHGGVEPTNELLSLVVGEHQLWVELNAPMPTKRANATAVTTEEVLVVAGGANMKKVDTVEIMILATKQWSVAMSLPYPVESASSAYCPMTQQLFLMGGEEESGAMKSVLMCTMDKLLHSCARFNRIHDSSEVWETTSELAVSYPSCVVVQEHLLALGGIESERKEDSRHIYEYDFTTRTWKPLTLIPSPTHKLLAAMLPSNKLMVLGGFTKVNISDNVYFANVSFE